MTYDPLPFLERRPRRELKEPTTFPPYRTPREWKWPFTKAYLGYTPRQRVRLWQLQWWLISHGVMDKWTECEMCGSTERLIGFHADDYYDVTRAPAMCQKCHYSLHRRETDPRLWERTKQSARIRKGTDDGWWEYIPPEDFDLARFMRGQYPEYDLDDFFRSPLFTIPEDCPEPLGWLGLRPPRQRGPIQPTLDV